MKRQRSSGVLVVGGLFAVAGIVLMVLGWMSRPAATPPVLTLAPSPTPEPLVPTRTPELSATLLPASTASATLAPAVTETPTHTLTPVPTSVSAASAAPSPVPTFSPAPTTAPAPANFVVPAHERFRLGVSLPGGASQVYDLRVLGVGWTMDWNVRSSTALPAGVDYAQTVRMKGGVLTPNAATLTGVAAARPGSTWLISNEADVRWQDNVDPATYARLYHEAYTAIKAGDPLAVVAAGGIAQPSALRHRYLDLVLDAYRVEFGAALPAQAWHIHNYMLREERDSWGVDIPPGISDNTGVLYSIDDSGNLDLFRTQIWDFRRWMSSRGYGGQPLMISEFGVVMPEEYGFPPELVANFLEETWRFFLTAADPALGDPNDDGRLVQRWCWFSMAYSLYPTGDLLYETSGTWTSLGHTWISFVRD